MIRPSCILIVDDEPIGRETLESLLTTEGYQLSFAENGPQAIAVAHQTKPDLILLDVMMPGMDGYEVCQVLRADAETAEIPIFLITALDDSDSRIRGITAGADDFISKPYNRLELRARIKNIIQLNRYRLLLAERARFESLFNQSPDAIIITDASAILLEFNPALTRLTGLQSNNFPASLSLSSLFHEKDKAVINHFFALALEEESSRQSFEADIRTSQGEYLAVEVLITSFSWEDRKTAQVIIHDISYQVSSRQRIQQQLNMLDALFKSGEHLVLNLEAIDLSQGISNICVQAFEVCSAWVGKIVDQEWVTLAKSDGDCESITTTLLRNRWLINQISKPSITQPLIFTRFANPELFEETETQQKTPVQSAGFFPLISRGNLVGMLVLLSKEEFFFSPERINVLKTFASQSAAALETARLFEQTEQRMQHLQALRNVDIAITSSMDLETTFSVLLEQVLTRTPASAADILSLEQKSMTLRQVISRGSLASSQPRASISISNSLAGQVVLSRRILLVPNVNLTTTDQKINKWLTAQGFQAYIGIPLISKGKMRGILESFYTQPISPDEDQIALLESFASQASIAIDNITGFNELQQTHTSLVLAYDSTLISWASSLETRHFETKGHTERVADITLQLARHLGVPKEQLIHIWRGALLHDIGKIMIPDSILLKTGPLSEEEWQVIRQHPLYATQLLSPISYLSTAREIPQYHHERWDGSGYPEGLKGTVIPFSARIFMVVEVFDALLNEQTYRPAWPREKAIAHLRENAGILFDPNVVEKFLELLERGLISF